MRLSRARARIESNESFRRAATAVVVAAIFISYSCFFSRTLLSHSSCSISMKNPPRILPCISRGESTFVEDFLRPSAIPLDSYSSSSSSSRGTYRFFPRFFRFFFPPPLFFLKLCIADLSLSLSILMRRLTLYIAGTRNALYSSRLRRVARVGQFSLKGH